MVRRKSRTDANQTEIVKRFREWGCAVAVTSDAGGGFPDLVISRKDLGNLLVEIKDGDKSPSRRKLTPDQVDFHKIWLGPLVVVETVEQMDEICRRKV